MGEVYRASDTNLKRPVAIKVLPPSLAADPDRAARFRREAEVLALLNHPNIAVIHGLERTESTTALVMEFVEGPTLADRLSAGALPLDEALVIARHIAEALEAGDDQGVIHRDLKPAKVKVRPDDVVKVLDFGLAKALDRMGDSGTAQSAAITSPALTERGMLLGTAAYMAPEQARGRPVDRRADIFAFGCVVVEMLAGRRAFDGDSVSDTIAAVLRGDPDWSAMSGVPPPVQRLLRRCLQKDPRVLQGRCAPESSRSDRLPMWSPDGDSVQFTSAMLPGPVNGFEIRRRRVDRPEEEELVTTLPPPSFVTDWASDGEHIVYQSGLPWDLHRFAVSSKQSTPLVVGASNQTDGRISPNGRVLAFVSDESGRDEGTCNRSWLRVGGSV
jgi:serine/threonine protein kinase